MATDSPLGALLAVGRTAEVYAWGADKVLKLYFPAIPVQASEREARVGQIAMAEHLHAPAMYATVEIDGRRGLIFDRVQGPSMLEVLLAQPDSAAHLAELFAQVHADMHAAMPVGRQPQLPRLKPYLAYAIAHAPGLSDPLRSAALARLEHLPEGDALCHLDYHPGNIILAARGPVVIDWMSAVAGHPDADVARTVFLLGRSVLPPEIAGEQRAAIERVRHALLAAYLENYRRLRPCPQARIDAWLPVLAAARLAEGIPAEEKLLLEIAGGLV